MERRGACYSDVLWRVREPGVFNCDKCREQINADVDPYYLLYNPILGTYHICDGCNLALDRFVDSIDKRIEKRGRTLLRELDR
jgi:hypothetical protein